MADFTDDVDVTFTMEDDPGYEYPGIAVPSLGVTQLFLQRLFDTGLGAYVYFTRESVDPTTPPLAVGDTQPNNTGSFDFTNHAILAEVT